MGRPDTWLGHVNFLAAVYQGGELSAPVWMDFYWWGILGLIGWAYLIASLVFIAGKGKQLWVGLAFLAFMTFSALSKMGMLEFIQGIKPYFWLIDDGATPSFALAGILVTGFYRSWNQEGVRARFWLVLGGLSLAFLAIGFVSRPLWGIHKIGSSPSWVFICIAISMMTFGLLIILVEIYNKKHWFDGIRPAGTSTLTCYLLPYIHYGLLSITGIVLPLALRTGIPGILKSLVYAWIIIQITGLLEKKKLRLKI